MKETIQENYTILQTIKLTYNLLEDIKNYLSKEAYTEAHYQEINELENIIEKLKNIHDRRAN